MARWYCELIKVIFILFGSTTKFCEDNDSTSPWVPPSASSPHQLSLRNAGLPPAPISDQQKPTFDGLPPTNDLPASNDNLPPPSYDFLTESDNGPTSDTGINDKPQSSSTNPLEAVDSDLNKSSALSKLAKAPSAAGHILRLIQALQELKIKKIGDDFDEETEDLIQKSFSTDNEEKNFNTTDFIEKCGYPVEEYTVKTPDGYYLKLFRIPGSGPPVLLVHGVLVSSDDYLVSGCELALPYMVADAGFDVWLGNVRGDKYSQQHETLDPDTDFEFWNFSWHEIGVIDLPTIVDFILSYTDQPKLVYIGHSQGTTASFVMLSERPEYNDKLYLNVALSPIAYMGDLFSPLLQVLSQFADELDFVVQVTGMGKFMMSDEMSAALRRAVCGTSPAAVAVCDPATAAIDGFSPAHKSIKRLPVQNAHSSSSASKQLVHYSQEIRSGKFQQFDYGADTNQAVYGSAEPPEYPVERITAPTALFYSTNDWLSSVTDVMRLQERLPNVVYSHQLEAEYNHVDFVWAEDAYKLLYNYILELMEHSLEGF